MRSDKVRDHFADIKEVERHCTYIVSEVRRLADFGGAWIFLCGTAMIDWLGRLSSAEVKDDSRFIDFVSRYLGSANEKYRTFTYSTGETDLPMQMYRVLRCGALHSFSLVPQGVSLAKGGRERSVVLAHRAEGHAHLLHFTEKGLDAALFNAEDFGDDLCSAVKKLFSDALTDSVLATRIVEACKKCPPIIGDIEKML